MCNFDDLGAEVTVDTRTRSISRQPLVMSETAKYKARELLRWGSVYCGVCSQWCEMLNFGDCELLLTDIYLKGIDSTAAATKIGSQAETKKACSVIISLVPIRLCDGLSTVSLLLKFVRKRIDVFQET